MLDFLRKDSIIYIAAPARTATGGPELLHQLAFKLKSKGLNVQLYYYPSVEPEPVHDNYVEYEIPYVREIEDHKKNFLIVPEVNTSLLSDYCKITKAVWWLSIDHYFFVMPYLKQKINRFLLKYLNYQNYLFFDRKLKGAVIHFVQSEYAYMFLKGEGVHNVHFLSDFLHRSFLETETDNLKKDNIVAYNPKKGISFTERLITNSPDISFVPIIDMTRNEVIELLKQAKVYIDFGYHPGKDRIPREAAFLHCCVITNKMGSAAYYGDVPIKDEFKFRSSKSEIPRIRLKILECFDNYDQMSHSFSHYRSEIVKQESLFDDEVEGLFIRAMSVEK